MSGINLALPRQQGSMPYGNQQNKSVDEKHGNDVANGSGSGTSNGAVGGPGPSASAEKAFEQPKEITAVQGLVPTLQ